MKTILVTIAMLIAASAAQARTLECDYKASKLVISIDEKAKTLSVDDGGKNTLDFKIYDSKTYAVDGGRVVNSYSIKDGQGANGASYSGEFAALSDGSIGILDLLNDSLAKKTIETGEMSCKIIN